MSQERTTSLKEQQATETVTASTDDGSRNLTTELKVICTFWLPGAILAGIGFVTFSDVFAGLA